MKDIRFTTMIESGGNPIIRELYQSMQNTLHGSQFSAFRLRTPVTTLTTGTTTTATGTTTTSSIPTVRLLLGLLYG